MVRHLYEQGHDIASHSITLGNGDAFHGVDEWRKEMVGQKNFLTKHAAMHKSDVQGARSPYFTLGGDEQYKALYSGDFRYDSSILVDTTSKAPYWPYTMDFKIGHECRIKPCPKLSYPGLWQLPLNVLYGNFGEKCYAVDRCNMGSSEKDVFQILYNNFYHNFYNSNRAPFHIAIHGDWLNYAPNKGGLQRFLVAISALEDVWVVTAKQAIEWMRKPAITKNLHNFKPWQCGKSERKKPMCDVIHACPLHFDSRIRYFYTCASCPNRFPWVQDS